MLNACGSNKKNLVFNIMQALYPLFENFATRVVASGDVPRHVAFVADGARRFGKKNGISVQENHEIGLFGCLINVINLCLHFGVAEYSILMYSFGNYYRPEDEVNHWKDLFRLYLIKCIQNWKVLKRKGIRFNFYGKFTLIPEDINGLMAMLQLITRKNHKVTVNMVMGYTSKHELSSVAHSLLRFVKTGDLETDSISCDLMQECLFAVDTHNVDLMIRTSGFKRISNFLCWQVAPGYVYYTDVLWPEFGKKHFVQALLYYQLHKCTLTKQNCGSTKQKLGQRELKFLEKWKRNRLDLLYQYLYLCNFFPEKSTSMSKIMNYDYEVLYNAFKRSYRLYSECLDY